MSMSVDFDNFTTCCQAVLPKTLGPGARVNKTYREQRAALSKDKADIDASLGRRDSPFAVSLAL